MNWLADKIEQWPTAKLLPYARNARTHSEEQVAQIAASIAEFGWTNPVLVDEAGGVIAGHGRIAAAQQLGMERVPTIAKSDTGHGTQKPVECMRRPIENNSSPGHAVYEPFSGSGTTLIAAEMTGRSCLAIELHPPYVDVAVTRWQNFTGQKATLEGDGRTFEEIAAERVPA